MATFITNPNRPRRYRPGALAALLTAAVVTASCGSDTSSAGQGAAAPGTAPSNPPASETNTVKAIDSSTVEAAIDDHEHGGDYQAVDEGGLELQPAYFDGRVVNFRNEGPAPDGVTAADARILYEVEYPTGWEESLARPFCSYCDHNGDGESAWDYHDHVLTELPIEDSTAAYWEVVHVLPASTDDAAIDAEIAAAYAELLPADSADEVLALLETQLADGTPIAELIQTGYIFTAPLTRR